jgi:inorganic pyrophosphatase
MKYHRIPPLSKKLINVIIETPRDSQNKFTYDPELHVFKLKKTLPMGTTFPFDFGFVPNTEGADGDPLDVLVIMDQHAFPGCMVRCRALGILEAKQSEKNKKPIRNDRVVAVADCSIGYGSISNIRDLNTSMVEEIENFFIDYNKHEGKKFKPIKWCSADQAIKMIKKQSIPQTKGVS